VKSIVDFENINLNSIITFFRNLIVTRDEQQITLEAFLEANQEDRSEL
jgi:hypothetical protein